MEEAPLLLQMRPPALPYVQLTAAARLQAWRAPLHWKVPLVGRRYQHYRPLQTLCCVDGGDGEDARAVATLLLLLLAVWCAIAVSAVRGIVGGRVHS